MYAILVTVVTFISYRAFLNKVFRVFPFYILNNDMGTEALRLRP